jgi:hypothetical protein
MKKEGPENKEGIRFYAKRVVPLLTCLNYYIFNDAYNIAHPSIRRLRRVKGPRMRPLGFGPVTLKKRGKKEGARGPGREGRTSRKGYAQEISRLVPRVRTFRSLPGLNIA